MLEERTGIPTLGVLPYLDLSSVPAEDALEWGERRKERDEETVIDVAVLRLPRVANLDEFQPLIAEPGVSVRWVASPSELGEPDLIVVPGTKSTMADLEWLRERSLDRAIQAQRAAGTPVLGICGGFQMLGTDVVDEHGVEGSGNLPGLGLLPMRTVFHPEKLTRRVSAVVATESALWSASDAPGTFDGYEIHMGRTVGSTDAPSFTIDGCADGCVSADGLVVGTYMHGLLENTSLRRAMLARLAARKGKRFGDAAPPMSADQAIDALADTVRDAIDLDAIGKMVGLSLVARR